MSSKRYKFHKRLKPKRSRFKKILKSRFFWFGLAGLLFMGGVAYAIFFTPFFQIEHIQISGNAKVSKESLRESAQTHLTRKFLFFELNHFILADISAAAEKMKAAFPEIDSIVVQREFPDSFHIIVRERQGVALWCQQRSYMVEIEDGEESEKTVQECFALDKNGIIFEEKDPGREVIISEKGKNVALGEQVMDEELLAKILRFQQQLDSFTLFQEVGLRVSTLSIISKERVNAKISDLSGEEGWEMYLNPEDDIDWQITKVKLVLEQEIPSAKRPSLEYIDLRFGDQAYIKY